MKFAQEQRLDIPVAKFLREVYYEPISIIIQSIDLDIILDATWVETKI
jgi:hypothetical protein